MAEDIKVLLGKNIRKYRQKNNLSQTQLAEKIDVSFRYISYVECGKSFPSADVLQSISTALKVPVYQLFYPDSSVDDSTPLSALKSALVEATKDIKITIDTLENKIQNI